MGTFEQNEIPGLISKLSSLILSGGSWLFPISLLLITFLMKCFLYRRISGLNFYRSVIVLPIEIKTVACSFVLASVLLQPIHAIGLLFIAVLGLFILSFSIGVYNYLEVDNITNMNSKKANIYLFISFLVSAYMLKFSIVVMQYSEVTK